MTHFAKSSAHNLCKEYKTNFFNYEKYGNVVLDVDLKDEPEMRDIILKSKNFNEYEKKIREFWCQNYQIVISKCSDIEKAYESGINESISVTTDFSESDSLKSNVVVCADFFECLYQHAYSNFNTDEFTAYVETDKFIYQIYLWKSYGDRYIKIGEQRIAKDSIVTD